MNKNILWIVQWLLVWAVAGIVVAQELPGTAFNERDVVGKWDRDEGLDFKDTMEVRSNKTVERNFDGMILRGQWRRSGNGTITFDFRDGNPLTVRKLEGNKMMTVSESGLEEKWMKK